jgi:UDP-glucuronate decarboxylase
VSTATKPNGTRRNHKPGEIASSYAVCGGAGFLGTHLCMRLLREGHRVICVDNFCTSDPEAVEHLQSHPHFELIESDVASITVEQLGKVSGIFNLACAASPQHYQRNPLDTLFSSVHGTNNLLRIARGLGARLFQSSTSEIYGHPTIHPQSEDYWGHVNTVGPRACYDEGKRCAETLCFIYQQQYAVPVRIGRIFNTYGPGMRFDDGRVIINFIVQALAEEPLTVYGDGSQTRSFCYVDDLIDAIMRMMHPDNDVAGPINLGNPAEMRVLDLAEEIVRITGSRSRIVLRPLPVDDPPRRRPDISLAMRTLNWRPSTTLNDGLARTIEDVQQRLRKGDLSLLANGSERGRGHRAAATSLAGGL